MKKLKFVINLVRKILKIQDTETLLVMIRPAGALVWVDCEKVGSTIDVLTEVTNKIGVLIDEKRDEKNYHIEAVSADGFVDTRVHF